MILPDGTARPSYPADPLPSWVTALRPHQVDAVREIVDAFREVDVVFFDGPVGTGKTLIGELVRREMRIDHGLYICSDKALQDQFLADYPYAKVLKGRSNYATLNGPGGRGGVTAEDCTYEGGDSGCLWCDPVISCPYRVAKQNAYAAKVGVLNTSYFLAATNHVGDFRNNKLVVADEADMLEGALVGFTEYDVPDWIGKLLGLDYPKKGVHKPTLVAWLTDTADRARVHLSTFGDAMEPKQRNSLRSFGSQTVQVAGALQRDIDSAADGTDDENGGSWIREYHRVRTLKLLPVTVSGFGVKNLWRHGTKWLCMSGTIISGDEMADSLGLPLDYRTIAIPSPFPVENRPIILAPVANVTRKAEDRDYEALALAIERIAERHPGRILVHCVSYHLAERLAGMVDVGRRPKITYDDSRGKHDALDRYLRGDGSIMFAPSMSRGVDLAGDKCTVQIIAKCPFPSLGDKRIGARLRLSGGQQWYATQTVRDIVQMTGRGVRSASDTCTTYILDQQFTRNVWGKHKYLFPAYFQEAVDARADNRWMVQPRDTSRSRQSA